jgi:hypothetical protein
LIHVGHHPFYHAAGPALQRRLMMATDLDTLMLRAEPTLPQLWMRQRRLAARTSGSNVPGCAWCRRLWSGGQGDTDGTADRGRQVMLSPDEIFAQDIGALWCSTAAACSVQTARSGSRPLERLSQGGCVGHLGSGSSFTYGRDGWAGRCGWMLPILILTTRLRSFRFRRRRRRSALRMVEQLRRASTGHPRCGRCGSSPGWRTDGWGCS